MSSSLNLVDLLEASTKVTDWYTLGVYLKMPSEVLQDIERRLSREGLKRCKIELFNAWMNRYPNASWAEIAQALEKCDENTTAELNSSSVVSRQSLPSSATSVPPFPSSRRSTSRLGNLEVKTVATAQGQSRQIQEIRIIVCSTNLEPQDLLWMRNRFHF